MTIKTLSQLKSQMAIRKVEWSELCATLRKKLKGLSFKKVGKFVQKS